MSDLGRKDFSQKIGESLKPDSEKTTFEKAKESVTDTADKLASKVTPEGEKSFSQTVGDSVQSSNDEAKTWGDSANEYLESGKKAVSEAADYVSNAVNDARTEAGEYFKKK